MTSITWSRRRGLSAEAKEFFLDSSPHAPTAARIAAGSHWSVEPVHIPDVLQDPEYTYREGQKIAGYRTMLGIPLLREETLDRHIFRLPARASNPLRTRRSSWPPASPTRR